mgnify:CR=1 FL=1
MTKFLKKYQYQFEILPYKLYDKHFEIIEPKFSYTIDISDVCKNEQKRI